MITIKDKVIAEHKKKLPTIMPKEEPCVAAGGGGDEDDEEGSAVDKTEAEKPESIETGGATGLDGTESYDSTNAPKTEVPSDAVTVTSGGDEKMECEEEESPTNTTQDTESTDMVPVEGLTQQHHQDIIRLDIHVTH